jgi:hypothetical protein
MTSAQDAITGWSLLRELYRKQGANDAKALVAADRLNKLVNATWTLIEENEYYESDWWD